MGQWTILLYVGGKNRAADSNFGEKTASRSRSFETAVSSLDFVYRKLRQTPENPPKTMKLAKWTTEIRQGEFIYLILFKKSSILFHCAILSFVILKFHTMPCRVLKLSTTQCVTQHRTLKDDFQSELRSLRTLMFIGRTRWNANRCYSLRTTYLIFETFQSPFPTDSLIFTAVKLFHEVI